VYLYDHDLIFWSESCVWICFLGPGPRFWELWFKIEYHALLAHYVSFALSLVFVFDWIYFIGPEPSFWELRFEIGYCMIVAQCFTLLTFEIWERVPYKFLLTLSFKIWDFGYNNIEISILNNPLYIANILHPGSKRAKVLPELCPLVSQYNPRRLCCS